MNLNFIYMLQYQYLLHIHELDEMQSINEL